LRPPAIDVSRPIKSQFGDLLQRWAELCPRPILLFLDEIDALFDDTLISVLRQLRAGFPARPGGFPQSVVLIGLRDVRDYKLEAEAESESLGTASPFNIKVESLTLRNFVQEEIAELYAQHEAETRSSRAQNLARRPGRSGKEGARSDHRLPRAAQPRGGHTGDLRSKKNRAAGRRTRQLRSHRAPRRPHHFAAALKTAFRHKKTLESRVY